MSQGDEGCPQNARRKRRLQQSPDKKGEWVIGLYVKKICETLKVLGEYFDKWHQKKARAPMEGCLGIKPLRAKVHSSCSKC